MRENLDDSLLLIFGDEGGYVNVKSDRGGPTKYGITHRTLALSRGVRSVSAEAVKQLSLEEAEKIYRSSYWTQAGGDVLPAGLDYSAFDFGITSGPKTAVMNLQKVLKQNGSYRGKIDGWIGTGTTTGVVSYSTGIAQLIKDYNAQRMVFLRSLKNKKTGFAKNGRGWTIRVTGVDPKGSWPTRLGVVGNAIAMFNKIPVQIRSARVNAAVKAEAEKAPVSKQPEMISFGTVAALLPAIMAAPEGPIQYAVAGLIITTVVIAAWFFIRRYNNMEADNVI